jgi:hypothetical protein
VGAGKFHFPVLHCYMRYCCGFLSLSLIVLMLVALSYDVICFFFVCSSSLIFYYVVKFKFKSTVLWVVTPVVLGEPGISEKNIASVFGVEE